MPRKPKPLTWRKLDQIEQRRYTVVYLWLQGWKQTHIARLFKVSVKTVARDIEVVKTWPEVHKATFEYFRREVQEMIDALGREVALSFSKIRGHEKRIRLGIALMGPLIEMWKKLMPKEIKDEEYM